MPIRFYQPPEAWNNTIITGEEAHHAIKVLRVKTQQTVELFNGTGAICRAHISEINNKSLTVVKTAEWTEEKTLPEIHLYQSIPKGKNMDLIIQKAVELGVSSIHPMITDHTIAISDNFQKKREKWQRIALEACKQCKQSYLPKVALPLPISALLEAPLPGAALFGALTEDAKPMSTALQILSTPTAPTSLTIATGPEGDFTPQEVSLLCQKGFQPVTLGKLTLRVETATLYMLSAIRFHFS